MLRDELLNDPLSVGYINMSVEQIVTALNAPTRTRVKETEIGNGTILAVLGLATGNALLDVLTTNQDFRHVKPLLEQGRLRLDDPLTQQVLDSFVGTILTQAQCDALKAKTLVPCSRAEELGISVTASDVRDARSAQ